MPLLVHPSRASPGATEGCTYKDQQLMDESGLLVPLFFFNYIFTLLPRAALRKIKDWPSTPPRDVGKLSSISCAILVQVFGRLGVLFSWHCI